MKHKPIKLSIIMMTQDSSKNKIRMMFQRLTQIKQSLHNTQIYLLSFQIITCTMSHSMTMLMDIILMICISILSKMKTAIMTKTI